MFQELGEGTVVIHGEAREALPDGLRRRLNPPKPRGKAKANRSSNGASLAAVDRAALRISVV